MGKKKDITCPQHGMLAPECLLQVGVRRSVAGASRKQEVWVGGPVQSRRCPPGGWGGNEQLGYYDRLLIKVTHHTWTWAEEAAETQRTLRYPPSNGL